MPDTPLGEPPQALRDPLRLLEGQLDHLRDAVLLTLDAMSDDERRRTRVPSGWAPIGLLTHLTHVERRWLEWGFLAEQVADPWGDATPEGGWSVADDTSYEELRRRFVARTARSREITSDASLEDVAQLGGRFSEDPPNLAWILLHLVQEYARHAGHLDIVAELAGAGTEA
ncbi:DUF664 domain-containing protein [Mumia sp. ZJ1417]|uniref:mycothiol transferase n=1 Tax=Mumia sp. ZJ1417 TaxID=2708082 RepID=UPI00141E9593|nr:DUF664 domain-containing protein [Mumia sp. ZJ1417]QMW65036.1 DUF664 domain-containing protein [Mumia sp. ZJ1417]